MRVIYHNREKLSESLSGGAQYVSFKELLSTSDVISLNLPLNVSEHSYLSKAFGLFAALQGWHRGMLTDTNKERYPP